MGSRILAGRYELLERIGEGGMAVVFKAKDRLLNRMVAIKILKPEFTKDEVFIESFRRESQLAASIVHQNIVNVYDVGKEGNIHYIVMEHIDGQPLSDIIKEEAPLEAHRAVSIAKQVASALSAAHNHQLIHRDVKPHNILLTSDGIAKITDFGIAKAVTTNTFVGEEKEAVMGSVHYFSPEQARGAYVDERSDIYSLGIVMYEMLTGKVPFDGDTAVEVAVKHMNNEMLPPSKLNPEIPQDVEDIIMKATDKIQVNRFKNADDLILALNFVKFSKLAPQPEPVKLEETPKQKEKASKESKFAPDLITSDDSEDTENVFDGAKKSKAKSSKAKGRKKQRKPFKLKHPQVLVAIVIALILAVPAAKYLGNKLQFMQPSPSTGTQSSGPAVIFQQPTTTEVDVPKITGLTEDEARDVLEHYGLKLKIEREVVNDNYRIGEIVSQTPSDGSKVKTGYTIKANICRGKTEKTVPNVVGKTLSSAKEVLTSYGYKVGSVSEIYDSVIEKGFVISQNPSSGKSLSLGSSVNLTVSLGPEEIAFGSLNLINITLEEALEQIDSMGVTTGSIQYVSNANVEKDHIISQNPGAGVVLEEGQAIDLVVSSGEEEPEVNNLTYYSINIDVPFDQAEENPFDLIVIVKDEGFEPSTFRETHYAEEMMTTVTVTGATENAKVLISFGNKLMYQYTVNFPAGTYQ